jgi:cytosine/adenosine deaminase-related metal-dependent hydrolase
VQWGGRIPGNLSDYGRPGSAVGAERMRRWLPIREALATRALIVAGSDWSVVPSVNPWLGMETMVTRQKSGGSAETLGEGEAIGLEDAFRIFTLNAERLMRQDALVGSIEVGKHADLIVTVGYPFSAAITDLHSTKVRRPSSTESWSTMPPDRLRSRRSRPSSMSARRLIEACLSYLRMASCRFCQPSTVRNLARSI